MTQSTNDTNTTAERQHMTSQFKKKLIEVSLPLRAINEAAQHEKSVPRRGHPSTMHLYWAPRPLAAARAVLFAQLVDDPSAHPDRFPTEDAQDVERARLHDLLSRLVRWENSNDENLLAQARVEIERSNPGGTLTFLDPFSGGGAIPLEAQRLGLLSTASDLNPVAILRTKGLIEIPPLFENLPPVSVRAEGRTTPWRRAEGLAEDVRVYGQWVRDESERRLSGLYPAAVAPGGTEHKVVAWIWARTVRNPNPANPMEVPIVATWWLSKKNGKEAYIVPTVIGDRIRYEIRNDGKGPTGEADGTRVGRGAVSIADGTPISAEYIKAEGAAGRLGAHLIAVVAEGKRGRLYLAPTEEHVEAARVSRPANVPDQELPYDPRNIWTPPYGLTRFADLFTNRQLTILTTLSDLIGEVREAVVRDAESAGLSLGERLEDGGNGAIAYGDAVATYLAFAVSKLADWSSTSCSWINTIQGIRDTFARQSIPMAWDYAEVNPFSDSAGNFLSHVKWVAEGVAAMPARGDIPGQVVQADASTRAYDDVVISTDPPYYDNISYSDLSDFFYVWLRRSIGDVHRKTLGTLLTPKAEELVANQYRHDGKKQAAEFFVDGFNRVFSRMRIGANLDVPMTVYYAYKQQDTRDAGATSTGWHTLLDGLIHSGWEITATWPMRSERSGRMLSVGTNALASSIVLACRPRPSGASATTRRSFIAALKSDLPGALRDLLSGDIAPVDLAQAAIGPGISVFSRYSRVREADGSDMSVKDALSLINSTLDEVLGEQEGDFDSDTRFAIKWYRQYGWTQENSGIADQLARSSDTSIGALERGGIFEAKGGKARLLAPSALDGVWDAAADDRVSVWEATVRLAAVMAKDGADKVAELIPTVQTRVSLDAIKELGFLLFHEAEKKKDSKDAGLFNGLVSAWGDLNEHARKFEAAESRMGAQQTFDLDELGD
jgi:putative DNA methylase